MLFWHFGPPSKPVYTLRAFFIPVYGFVWGGKNVGRQSLPNRKRSL